VEFLLLGYFALEQSREDSRAGVHQTAVAVVFMRFDSADIELSISAIITVLPNRRLLRHKKKEAKSKSVNMQ